MDQRILAQSFQHRIGLIHEVETLEKVFADDILGKLGRLIGGT